MNEVEIAGSAIGFGHPCFVIAEAGVNHNGDLDTALQLVDAAAAAGADAVKFQTFKADRMISVAAPKAEYQMQTTDASESQLDMVRTLELSPQAHRDLSAYSRERGLLFMSTPFDEESVDLLEELEVPVFKIGSGEITNLPFLEYIARKQRPIILSTGMSYLGEVDEAVKELRNAGCRQLLLLHCVSNYPAAPADANLRAMETMRMAFQVPVGYSDHTPGIEVSLAAVALGACAIEKHFTVDKNLPGPDHRASLEPSELAALIKGVRVVEAALGHGEKRPVASEANTAAVARRSLVAAQDISAGTVLTREMIAIKRPGTGLPPAVFTYLLGRTTCTNIPAGTIISLEMLA